MNKWILALLFLPLASIAEETYIESNDAHYNGNMITLTGDVMVENAMGKVTAENATLIRDDAGTTKLDFPWVELTRTVTLTLPTGSRLDCDRVFFDYTKMTSYFTGCPQIAYSEERGEVWADEGFVDYVEAGESIKPTKVRLVNNVQLIFLENDQYALADLVTYYPDKQLMILEGLGDKRVLFFDKQRNMQLSAKKVHATRNPETKKDSIQGVGDVRFVFGEEELLKFKERFQW